MTWKGADILRLDAKYAQAGLAMHARPFRAAHELLGANFSIGTQNLEVERVVEAYERLIPSVKVGWPGMGKGLAAAVDDVRQVTVGVVYGAPVLKMHQMLGFQSHREWELWCRGDLSIASSSCYAAADLFDLTYGIDDLRPTGGEDALWIMSLSYLADTATSLAGGSDGQSAIQTICLTAELSMKACLVSIGIDPKRLAKKDIGHNLVKLATMLATNKPHPDDQLVQVVVAGIPNYVDSRYSPVGLTRLQIVKLALGSQFIAASSARRLTDRNFGENFTGSFPGPRRIEYYV